MTDANRSILVADDDDAYREAILSVLEQCGYQTVAVEDGQSAVEQVQQRALDLLLLDMHMPRLTGYQVLLRVKNFNRRLPCILMSAEADDVLRHKAELADAFCVLDKPLEPELLRSTVRRALADAA